MLAQLVILVVGLVFMPAIVHVIAPGFADNPGQLALTVSLARITFPYLILTLVAIQLSAMLNAIDRFWAAAAWSNFQNLGMITTLICWRWFPNAAYAAAWGVLLGGLVQLFFMLWAARHDRLDLRIVRPKWTPEVREFLKALGAVTVGTATTLIAPLVAYVFTFLAGTGHIFYPLLPVIYEVSMKRHERHERPIAVATIASQQAITASPVSIKR